MALFTHERLQRLSQNMTQSAFHRLFLNRIRGWRFRLTPGVTLAPGYRLGSSIRIRPGPGGLIPIDIGCWLEDGVVLDGFGGTIRLGRTVFLGPYTVVYGHGGVSIGDNCLIAMHCRILSSNHTIAPVGTPIRTQPDIQQPTHIGNDVWIGAGVTILGGVTIGDGAVVGAGSVVTKDLPAFSIAHGVAARVVGWREGGQPTN